MIDMLHYVLNSTSVRFTVLDQEAGVEGYHDDPSVLLESPENLVRHIPVVIKDSPGAAVGEYDRGCGDVKDIIHSMSRHVGDVHHHAEPVHLLHNLLSQLKAH